MKLNMPTRNIYQGIRPLLQKAVPFENVHIFVLAKFNAEEYTTCEIGKYYAGRFVQRI